MRKFVTCASILALMAFAVPAQASVILAAQLRGAEEVPPNGTTATGSIMVTLHDDNTLLDVSETFAGLVANATGAHIHCCALPGANAPIALDFVGFFPNSTSGSFTHTFNLSTDLSAAFVTAQGGAVAAKATFLAGLLGGTTYANIHNSVFPGGQIRGQLYPLPEPGSAALLLASVIGLAFIRRHRAR